MAGLTKTEVRKLAEYLHVPDDIRNAIPSAELWDDQTDEGEMGFCYEEADLLIKLKTTQDPVLAGELAALLPLLTHSVVQKSEEQNAKNRFKPELPYCFDWKG